MKNKIQDLFSKVGVLRMAAELSDEERYDYTLRQIARNRAAWLLADGDGGGISMELGGKECICIWRGVLCRAVRSGRRRGKAEAYCSG